MKRAKLLVKQLKRLGLNGDRPPSDQETWRKFLQTVAATYSSHDEDRYLLERSLTLSSEEMAARWTDIQFSRKVHVAILETALDAIVTIDHEGKVVEFNATAEFTFGYKRDSIIGKSAFDTIFACESAAEFVNQLRSELSDSKRGTEYRTEQSIGRPVDGSELSIELSYSFVRSDGDLLVPIFIRDLSERQKMEAMLAEERAKAITAAKFASLGQMAGGIAHEINNPLAVIQTLAGQLQDLTGEDAFDKALFMATLSEVTRTSERIAKIVTGLRSFSRNGSNDPSQPVDISQIIEETLPFCRSRLSAHAIELWAGAVPQGLVFSGRAVEISQVLLNLLNNACDAIEGLDERWIQVGARAVGDRIELSVTDSGRGISTSLVEKLFQPFFTTKDVGKGTGMGLSISRKILESHGGELIYDRACPRTRFVIRLPALRESASSVGA